jgi:electron transport complex protein RnfA
MEYFLIFIAAIFVNNIVLSQFLGICPFLGVSKKISTAAGMGLAVTFVLTVAVIVTYALQNWVLNPYGLGYLQTILFILVIAGLVQMLEIILKKVSPSLYQALGIFLPLITTNCAVLGVTTLNIDSGYNYAESLINAAGSGFGFMVAMVIFAGVRGRLETANIPKTLQGLPITLVSASIVACSFLGFNGLVDGIFK